MTSSAHRYDVSPSGVGRLLIGGGEFVPPERLLGDLTEAQALTTLHGSPYSIAGIVAHIHFWQGRNIARALGERLPRPKHLDDTFPPTHVGEWASLRASFLAGIDKCSKVAVEKAAETSPDRNDASLGYDLAECPALHSAYHFGQIAMLRQIQGWWPPEGGDDSW